MRIILVNIIIIKKLLVLRLYRKINNYLKKT